MKSITTALFLLFCGYGILSAQEPVLTDEASSSVEIDFIEDFKSGMIDLSKELIDVTEDIESVEDVMEAESDIEEAMSNFVVVIQELSDNMTPENLVGLQELQNLQTDPEVKKWADKSEAEMARLQKEHPEAAAKLEELAQKHSAKLQAVMMTLMQKAMQMQGGMMEGTK